MQGLTPRVPRALLVVVVLALVVRVVVVAATPDFVPRYDAADFDHEQRPRNTWGQTLHSSRGQTPADRNLVLESKV